MAVGICFKVITVASIVIIIVFSTVKYPFVSIKSRRGEQASVVGSLDNVIPRMNRYIQWINVNKTNHAIRWIVIYPPSFEQLEPDSTLYQYSNKAPRLSGETSTFGVVFFIFKSLLRIERQ